MPINSIPECIFRMISAWICAAYASNGTINSDFPGIWRGNNSASKKGRGSSKEVVRLWASTTPQVGHRLFEGFAVEPLRPRQLLARSGARIGSPGAVDLLEPVDAFNISVPLL
jgi:hypothetical protein